MLVEIVNSSGSPIPQKLLRELDVWLRRALINKLPRKKKFLQKKMIVAVLNQSAARKLNREFRGRNYATDVLSFSPVEKEDFGELVFCLDVIKRQAKEHKLSVKKEFAYMYIHGVLHLLGFDHEKSKSKAEKMFKLQDDLFESFCRKLLPR